MYCPLAATVSLGVLAVLLFRETFEGCRGSCTTDVSRMLFSLATELYSSKKFPLLLRLFSWLGHGVAGVFFFRGLPAGFYLHCYPVMGAALGQALGPPSDGTTLGLFKNVLLGFLNVFSGLLNRPLGHFYVYAFLGFLTFVRLAYLALLAGVLVGVVRFSAKLLGHRPFPHLLAMVLGPAFGLAGLVNFALTGELFSLWYLVGLGPVFAALYCSFSRRGRGRRH